MAMKNEISKYKKHYECRIMKISKIFNPRLIWKTTRPDQLFHSSLFNSDSEYEANAVLHGDTVD
ncbi:hypothetical protein T09_14440 [Trichinella sp. T9]|nr:hypothetical protein T09_14440 [Trichinella sp. T9]